MDVAPPVVLVTGATTPLGSALVKALLGLGRHVLAVGREERAPLTHPNLRYTPLDLTHPRAVRRKLHGALRSGQVHTIVHGAVHRSARRMGERAHRLNVGGTRLLLRLASESPGVKRFVFLSHGAVYRVDARIPDVIAEDNPVALGRGPQWVRDRVEADVAVQAALGTIDAQVVILRLSEVFGAQLGSQLHDYVNDRVCLRPMGYDPMINLLSVPDAVAATAAAVQRPVEGIFNVPGYDSLPLTRLIRLGGCRDVPVPGPLVGPLYAARRRLLGRDFDYRLNRWRFHFNGVLDGRRAKRALGYAPSHPLLWRSPVGTVSVPSR